MSISEALFMKRLLSAFRAITYLMMMTSLCGCNSDQPSGLTPQSGDEALTLDQGTMGSVPLTPAVTAGDLGGQGGDDAPRAGEQYVDPAGGLAGEPAGELAGELAGEPAGDPAGELAGELAGEPAGELTGESAGESAGEPAGESIMPVERLGAMFSQYADDNWDALKEVSLGQISGGTDCAAYVSAALRDFGFDVWAVYTDGLASGDRPDQTLAYSLFELGFSRIDDPQQLRAGDICFSEDNYYDGVAAIECDYPVSDRDGWFPAHTYIFMEWEIEGSTEMAWIVDNQGRRHLRNITAPGPNTPFQYFVRYQEP